MKPRDATKRHMMFIHEGIYISVWKVQICRLRESSQSTDVSISVDPERVFHSVGLSDDLLSSAATNYIHIYTTLKRCIRPYSNRKFATRRRCTDSNLKVVCSPCAVLKFYSVVGFLLPIIRDQNRWLCHVVSCCGRGLLNCNFAEYFFRRPLLSSVDMNAKFSVIFKIICEKRRATHWWLLCGFFDGRFGVSVSNGTAAP